MTLPASAAERRAVVRSVTGRLPPAAVDRYLLPWVLSSKPAACHSGCRTTGQTDDGQSPDRYTTLLRILFERCQ